MGYEEKIEKYALINAIEHNGKAMIKPVLNMLLSEEKELKNSINEIRKIIEAKINEINLLPLEEQKNRLERLGGYQKEYKEERRGLKDLDNLSKTFVVRFAPNPDGALTLGNARPAVLCDEYAKRYNGIFILRFDDTDPKVKIPEKRFYKWIKEDLEWLGIKIDKIVYQSKRLKTYYVYAERLIKMGKAYVCTCDQEKWKEMRNRGEPCPCRELSEKEHLERWKRMFSEYKEGEAVLRIKTDIKHSNLAVRDFPAMRIVDNQKHPLVRKRYKVWPLYNLASGLDDHLLGITHILRGQEHSTNATKQEYIYRYFNWQYPQVCLLGRLSMSDTILSKSKIRAGIKEGKFSGWDDPKLGTLRALRRRGFHPQALRKIIIDIGLKSSDAQISKENLEAYNKDVIDSIANRYFFISEPVRIRIRGLPIKSKSIRLHPTVDRGYRELKFEEYFLIEKEDFNKYKGKEVRLKDLCNVILERDAKLTSLEVKPIQKIHWVPYDYKIRVKVIMPDKVIKGYGELNLRNLKPGSIIQFERFGFVRTERISKNAITAIFSHG